MVRNFFSLPHRCHAVRNLWVHPRTYLRYCLMIPCLPLFIMWSWGDAGITARSTRVNAYTRKTIMVCKSNHVVIKPSLLSEESFARNGLHMLVRSRIAFPPYRPGTGLSNFAMFVHSLRTARTKTWHSWRLRLGPSLALQQASLVPSH